MAWDAQTEEDDGSAGSILFGLSSRPKGLDLEREKSNRQPPRHWIPSVVSLTICIQMKDHLRNSTCVISRGISPHTKARFGAHGFRTMVPMSQLSWADAADILAGKLVATGSVDSSVKLADAEKMRAAKEGDTHDEATKNVTRSFYDHTMVIWQCFISCMYNPGAIDTRTDCNRCVLSSQHPYTGFLLKRHEHQILRLWESSC